MLDCIDRVSTEFFANKFILTRTLRYDRVISSKYQKVERMFVTLLVPSCHYEVDLLV